MANAEVVVEVTHLESGEETQRSAVLHRTTSVIDEHGEVENNATEKSAPKDRGYTKTDGRWLSIISIRKGNFLPMWNNIFVLSCVLAVSIDPLFFYIPIINEKKKCLYLDQNLKTVTLLLRSAMDLPCLVHIISQIILAAARPRQRRRVSLVAQALRMAKTIKWTYFLAVDVLAILPIPQVVILVLLTRTTASKSMNERKFLNSLILFQYLPRIFRMYLNSCKVNKEEGKNGHRTLLSLYKFILASHVLGAFWYFFSIQREMDCWQYACRRENKCEANNFDCSGNHTFKNVTFLDDLCPITTPNPTVFNFGIFLDALQSGILGSTDFPQKFLHCFWWALRNLSSFGQNLQTSTYAWENLFALGIAVVGMILFLIYLSAILQFANTEAERRQKREIKRKEVGSWLSRKGLPGHLKKMIMHFIDRRLAQNKDVDVDNILSLLPSDHSKHIKRYLCWDALRKVPMLQTMGERLLKAICDNLKPVSYHEGSYIIKEGKRLHEMIFITNGTVRILKTNGTVRTLKIKGVRTLKTNGKGARGKIVFNSLEKGNFYGAEELLNWASKFSSFKDLPISTRMVKPVTKVEAFTLSADDLKSIAIEYWWNFTKNKDLNDFDQSLLEVFAVSSIEKEIRRRRQAKKKRTNGTISSLNKLATGQGSASKKLQQVISKVMKDQLPSPVCALDH